MDALITLTTTCNTCASKLVLMHFSFSTIHCSIYAYKSTYWCSCVLAYVMLMLLSGAIKHFCGPYVINAKTRRDALEIQLN